MVRDFMFEKEQDIPQDAFVVLRRNDNDDNHLRYLIIKEELDYLPTIVYDFRAMGLQVLNAGKAFLFSQEMGMILLAIFTFAAGILGLLALTWPPFLPIVSEIWKFICNIVEKICHGVLQHCTEIINLLKKAYLDWKFSEQIQAIIETLNEWSLPGWSFKGSHTQTNGSSEL